MKLEKETKIKSIFNYDDYGNLRFIDRFSYEELEKLYKIENKKVKLIIEAEEPILDEEEKEYLSNVIKPFRDRVKYIKKKGCDNIEYIAIIIKNDDNLMFPNFEKGTMYKNLELNKEYSLEDLGL